MQPVRGEIVHWFSQKGLRGWFILKSRPNMFMLWGTAVSCSLPPSLHQSRILPTRWPQRPLTSHCSEAQTSLFSLWVEQPALLFPSLGVREKLDLALFPLPKRRNKSSSCCCSHLLFWCWVTFRATQNRGIFLAGSCRGQKVGRLLHSLAKERTAQSSVSLLLARQIHPSL